MAENSLTALLRTTHFLTRVADVGHSLGRGFAYWLGLGLVAVALDAVLNLPSWARALVGVAWLGSLIYLSGRFFARQWRTEFHPNRVARQVEIAIGISDNALVNAVDLAGNQTGVFSRQLVQVVVERGNDFGIRTAASEATRFAPALRWLAIGFGMAAMALLVHFIAPQLYSRVLPRYFQPFANHPPFTLLTFSWDVEPLPAVQGDDIFMQVQVDGFWLPEKAELLVLSDGNNPPTTIPLTSVADNQYELTLTNVQESMTVAIGTPLGQSQWQTLVVLQIPRILSTTVQYQFPEYTRWPPERKTLNVPLIRAFRETTVEFQVEASLPLQEGTLILDSPHGQEQVTLLPEVDQPTIVTGKFVLDHQTKFQISLRALNGSSDRENLRGKIEVLEDQPPRLEIVEPDRFVMAVEGWKVPIEIHAADDIELNHLELLQWRNEDPSSSRVYDLANKSSEGELPSITKTRNAVRITDQIDLAQMEARAGDRVKFFAIAEDNYPVGTDDSPDHRVTTPTFTIQVITLEEFQELKRQLIQMDDIVQEMQEIQDRLQELRDRRQELLAQMDALEQLVDADETDIEQKNAQRELLKKQLAEYEQEVKDLIDDLWEKAEPPPAYDFENSLHEQWRELLEQLDDQRIAAENVRQALDPSKPNERASDLQSAMENFRQQERPFDEASQQQQRETMEAIARLQAAEQMMELMQQLSDIIENQQQIAQQMDRFRDAGQDSPADETQQGAMSRLAKQQEMLQQELEELLEQMRETAEAQQENLPEAAEQLQELADQIEESGATEDQRKASDASRRGQGEQAADAAKAAAEKLLRCQGDCQGMQAGMGNQPGLGQPMPIPRAQMERSVQQMLEAIKGRAKQRGMPGQRPGQSGGAEGEAQGEPGEASDRRPTSRSSLMGPGDPNSRKSTRRRGNRSNAQDGSGSDASGQTQALSLEQLTPEAREAARRGLSGLRGVPSHYREHGRAYLQRLNEVDQQ